jgi:hypothetical protein
MPRVLWRRQLKIRIHLVLRVVFAISYASQRAESVSATTLSLTQHEEGCLIQAQIPQCERFGLQCSAVM